MNKQIKPGYNGVVEELLVNVKRACVRGRVAAQTESNMLATCDHIEHLIDEALSYFESAPPPLIWVGYTKGYPWRDSGYMRWARAASLHLGPFCVQWRRPYKSWSAK